MTWYVRIEESCAVVREPVAEPMAWKAALEGAKMVTSLRLSTVSTSLVSVRAPARAVRLESRAVKPGVSGMVRTLSTMCMTPLVKVMSCFVSR